MKKNYIMCFRCLEGDVKHEKIEIFGREDLMNEYATEFIHTKFNEGWKPSENNNIYVLDNNKYELMTCKRTVHY